MLRLKDNLEQIENDWGFLAKEKKGPLWIKSIGNKKEGERSVGS